MEPHLVDPQSDEVDIDFDKIKSATLEELQKVVNECQNETTKPVGSSDSDSDSD